MQDHKEMFICACVDSERDRQTSSVRERILQFRNLTVSKMWGEILPSVKAFWLEWEKDLLLVFCYLDLQ